MIDATTAPLRRTPDIRRAVSLRAGWTTRCVAWVFACALAIYLALAGGGYDIVVRSEIGLIVWWFVLLGVLIGVLPHARVPRAGWTACALLGGFVVWMWLGLGWSSSHELTLAEVGRVSTYLGVFLLALCALSVDSARSLVNGLAAGISAVCALAILSRLSPSLFPTDTASSFYQTPRLSYPFDYADGVGEYAALALPLVFYAASSARSTAGRAVAGAAIPPVLLCLAMTVSRGGILAAIVGMVVFFALVPNRVPRLATLLVASAGIAVLMAALLNRPAIRDSLTTAPATQRHSMLLIVCAVVAGSALAHAAAQLLMRRVPRPTWSRVSRHGARSISAGVIFAGLIIVVLGFLSGTVSHLWHEFQQWEPAHHSNQYFRLLSLAGSHRYQYWQIAWRAFESSPLHGIGAGTFRYYWEQHTTHAEYILNAHSLWFETLAETGILGWALLAGFFALVVVGGAWRALGSPVFEHRTVVATATAGVAAFCAAASFDWVWQIGVVPMSAMLLAAVTLLSRPQPPPRPQGGTTPSRWRPGRRSLRAALAVTCLLALVVIAIPLASSVSLRASQAADRSGDLSRSLSDARTAQAIEPGAASPYVQEALVLEQQDDIRAASIAIAKAIRHEPSNYLLWLTASRLATEEDHWHAAIADHTRAQALYPTSTVFH